MHSIASIRHTEVDYALRQEETANGNSVNMATLVYSTIPQIFANVYHC